jgi:hypothetical protein
VGAIGVGRIPEGEGGMTLFLAILAVGILIVVGLLQTALKIRDVSERRGFTREYLGQLQELLGRIAKQGFDSEAGRTHAWLMHRGGKMQLELGPDGKMIYREPFGGPIWPDYEVLTNLIPKLRDEQLQGGLSGGGGPLYDQAASVCQDVLIRHDGRLQDTEERLRGDLLNPFALLRRGVEFVVTLPLLLLVWSGLLRYTALLKATETGPGRALTGIVALVGFLAAVVQILVGWDQAWKTLGSFF